MKYVKKLKTRKKFRKTRLFYAKEKIPENKCNSMLIKGNRHKSYTNYTTFFPPSNQSTLMSNASHDARNYSLHPEFFVLHMIVR